jgi:hypothetical protein
VLKQFFNALNGDPGMFEYVVYESSGKIWLNFTFGPESLEGVESQVREV